MPDSVPVETTDEAKAALKLAVEFAQDVFGGDAVFSARMDRDERSINNVDLFLAPKYTKKTKHTAKLAVSMTRHTKLLIEKHQIKIKQESAKGSMAAQGQALQTEFANWLNARGFEAVRGRPKATLGDDWETPEVMGAKKDRAAAEKALKEAKEILDEQVPKARQEAEKILAKAKESAVATANAMLKLRAEAEAEAIKIRAKATAQADAEANQIRTRAREEALASAQTEASQIRAAASAEAQ